MEVARGHIAAFGSLRELLTAERPHWSGRKGVGGRQVRRFCRPRSSSPDDISGKLCVPRRPLVAPEATRRFLAAQLRDRPYEVFLLPVPRQPGIGSLHSKSFFRGTIDGASVHTREGPCAQTLRHNASALILAHNHPSGVAEPSQADERITRRLKEGPGTHGSARAGSLHRGGRGVLFFLGARFCCNQHACGHTAALV